MQVPVRLIEHEKGSALLCVNLVVREYQYDTWLPSRFEFLNQFISNYRIMSGRGHGRGNITMTQAELTDLINTRVAEALAAYQAGTECTKYSLLLYHVHVFSFL